MNISSSIQATKSEGVSIADAPFAGGAWYDNRWRRLGAYLMDMYLTFAPLFLL